MRGRGIDFEHRFNTSRWAEDLLINSLNDEHGLVTVRYGISTIVPEGQELVYGQTNYKEPDLLVFKLALLTSPEKALLQNGTLSWDALRGKHESGAAILGTEQHLAVAPIVGRHPRLSIPRI